MVSKREHHEVPGYTYPLCQRQGPKQQLHELGLNTQGQEVVPTDGGPGRGVAYHTGLIGLFHILNDVYL